MCVFLQSPDIYKIYIEELKDGRIPYKDGPELIWLLLDFSSTSPSLFEQYKVRYLFSSCEFLIPWKCLCADSSA